MKRPLLITGGFIALATLTVWLATGAHRGWTKTSVMITEIEPVTGQENNFQRKQFVMGIELLTAGIALAGLLTAAAFLVKSKPNQLS